MSRELYLGLISGTSADAVDAALVDCSGDAIHTLGTGSYPLPQDLRQRIEALARPDWSGPLQEIAGLHVALGRLFAQCALELLQEHGVAPGAVAAIGSHGQTVRHGPEERPPWTVQLGDPSTLAQTTGITTVADFRSRDLAAGGEGAPLAPALHARLWSDPDERRAVLNLGGFANLTLLGAGAPELGFDTGPANALLDRWAERHLGRPYDEDGAFAASGRVDEALLSRLMAHPYLQRPPPKSTGHEIFNLQSLDAELADLAAPAPSPADVQATLLAFTLRSITEALHGVAADTRRVIACGGGVHNPVLMNGLRESLDPIRLETTAEHGVDPDFVEAVAFAWLAQRTLRGLPGNLPSVTGAGMPVPLGGIYPAGRG